jgi:hypothetical protein
MKLLLITAGITIAFLLKAHMPALYVSVPSSGITEALTPTPTPNSIQVAETIVKEFAPEGKQVVKEALEISYCESGWRWDALNQNTNGTKDHGSMQINDVHTRRFGTGFKNDLNENVRVAHEIWKKQGFNPWVCKKVLSYE